MSRMGTALKLVRQGCATSLEIASETGLSVGQSSQCLTKLETHGLIISIGTYWRPDHFGRPFKRYAPTPTAPSRSRTRTDDEVGR
jgi:predicted ArsR family transcriptional regulator